MKVGDRMKDVNILKNNGVNLEKSLELFGDIVTYNETLQTFLSDIDDKIDKLKNYKEVADMANYAILVHSLKSDAKYFGFDRLAQLAYEHEMESKANHIYYIYEHFDELMTELYRILNVVRTYFGQDPIKQQDANQPVKDKAILVVDDSNVIVSFIQKIFNNDFDVITAKDGQEAIDHTIISPLSNISNEAVAKMSEYVDFDAITSSLGDEIAGMDDLSEAFDKWLDDNGFGKR